MEKRLEGEEKVDYTKYITDAAEIVSAISLEITSQTFQISKYYLFRLFENFQVFDSAVFRSCGFSPGKMFPSRLFDVKNDENNVGAANMHVKM